MFVAACIVQLLRTQYEEFSDSEISGLYHSGFVHASTSLNFHADHNYVIHSSSCLSRTNETGTWIRQGNTIELTSTDFKKELKRFVPIRFNHHLYMIEPNRVPAFAEQARKGLREAPPFSEFPIKLDEKKPLDAFHESKQANWVPCEFRSYFELGTIRATVVRIFKDQRVELELNAKFTVLPLTRLGTEGRINMELQIESVTGAKAIAKVWYFDFSDRQVQKGDIFSSAGHVYPDSKKRFADLVRLGNP